MEIDLSTVERLREKTDYTYEEARAALERSGGDLLDALIEAERLHRTRTIGGGTFTTEPGKGQQTGGAGADPESGFGRSTEETEGNFDFSGLLRRIWNVLSPAGGNHMEIWREEERMVAIPLVILVLGLVLAFGVTGPLLLVGLVFGCRYRLTGPDLEGTWLSRGLDTVCDAAMGLRSKVMDRK